MLTMRLGGFSSFARTAIAGEENGDGAAPREEPAELELVGVGAAVEDEGDERERHRGDVREPDRRGW